MRRLLVPAVLCAVLLAACGPRGATRPETEPAADVRPGADGSFWLTEGRSADLGGSFRLTLVILADSRCPANVMCVWAGEAAVVVGPSHPNMRFAPDTLRLGSGPNARVDTARAGPHRLVLREVQPYPGTEAEGAPRAPRRARFERLR